MKKSIIAFILFFTFMFSWPIIGLAEENANISNNNSNNITIEQVQNNVVEKPQEPVVDKSATIEENNKNIDAYNEQVDIYNTYVAEENSKREEEYNEACVNVDSHNESEQQKVEQNEKDLEKQEKRDERIASDTESKTAEHTTDVNNLPNSWKETNASPQTITVEPEESDETYKVMNLHIYVDENSGDTYYSTHIENNNFYVDDNMKQNIILAEWECVEAGNNDIVTVYPQSKLYPNSGALFRRCLEGYTNGYWIPTQEFTSTSKDVTENWDENGSSTTVSYNGGTTDGQPIKNILNVFVYNFLRYGAEPEKITKYTPDFWNYPDAVVYLEPLNKIGRLAEEQPEPEPSPDPSPEINPKPEPTPEPEINPEPEPEINPEPEPEPEINHEPKPDPGIAVTPDQEPEPEPIINNLPENKVEKTIITQNKEDIKSIETVEDTIDSQEIREPFTQKVFETQTVIREVPIITTINNTETERTIERVENVETTAPTPADLTSKETKIADNETPLANGEKKKEERWALVNLIAMIIAILSAIKIPKKNERKEDDENAE